MLTTGLSDNASQPIAPFTVQRPGTSEVIRYLHDGSTDSADPSQRVDVPPTQPNAEPSSSRVKKATMGTQEKAAAKEANTGKHNKLMAAINDATAVYEGKLEKIAEDHGVQLRRVKQLALHAPPITRKRKVSDWNIMIHFKSKELNEGE